ncbi:MAG: hypothetical protein V1754_13055, partial [Pseudomonadota bacterium]
MKINLALFDRARLDIKPLADRVNDLDLGNVLDLEVCARVRPELMEVGRCIREAKQKGSAVILFLGAHVLRAGVQRYVIDLMEKGFVSCIGGSGACAIHDYELSLIGATTESVAKYISDGQFGLWRETGELNDIVAQGAKNGLGLGEAVGKA